MSRNPGSKHSQMSEQQQQNQQQQHEIQREEEEEDCLVSCRCESAKPVTTLLTCLKAPGTLPLQPVTVFVSQSSITFHVYGTARQSQASVDLQAGLFSYYHVNFNSNVNANTRDNVNTSAEHDTDNNMHTNNAAQGGEFCVNLSTVLECLFVLGTHSMEQTKLSMSYNLHTEIFKLELLDQESGVLSSAAIPGMVVPTTIDGASAPISSNLALAFRSNPIVARIVLKSHILLDALQELEAVPGVSSTTNSSICTIMLSPTKGLQFSTVGSWSDCVITIPPNSTSVSLLECTNATTTTHLGTQQQLPPSRSYPMSSIASAMRGLEYAQETCLSINQDGMIAIQHQVMDTVGQGSHNFVDCIMTCLLPNNNDDNDDTSRSTTTRQDSHDEASSLNGISQSQPLLDHSFFYERNKQSDVTPAHTNRPEQFVKSTSLTNSDSSTEDEFEKDGLPAVSAIPLFGTLETELTSVARNIRRRYGRQRRSLRCNPKSTRNQNGEDTDGCQEEEEEQQQQHQEEQDPLHPWNLGKLETDSSVPWLDVTAQVSTPPRRRLARQQHQTGKSDDYDGSSSPELIYQ